MRRPVFLAALLSAVPFVVLSGCGGGDSTSATVATTALKLDIGWTARSRGVSAPSSALSAVVSLRQGAFAAINRNDDPAAYTQSYVSPTKVIPGPNLLTVTFYSGKNGSGAVVGTASKAINLADDGTGAGEVLLVGKIQKVAVTSPTRLLVGQSADLGLSATDGNGATVAVSPGSTTFSLLSGGENVTLTPDGKLTAKAVGFARVQAALDGKTSEPFEIEVRAPGTATAVIAAGQSVKLGQSKKLEYSFTDADGNPISYDPTQLSFEVTSGSDVASVSSNGTVTAAKLGLLKLKAKIPGLESAVTTVTISPAGSFTVTIPEQQNVKIGETKNLTIDVKDTAGAAIPVGTDGLSVTVTRGGETLTVTSAGAATGVAAGYAVVQASVAGTTSASQVVLVGDIVTNPSGLKYIEKVVGTGVTPQNGQTVTVNYTGALLNGTIFDSSLNPGRTPFSFGIGAGQVIKGFEEGASTMKVGGKRLLIIPSDLGYGERGSGSSIPPNSTLLFDLELLEVSS
ncbi:hypothetical protein HNQ39_004259 [Armatimonas rosea]|uniref:peptidylprolyl isomerase n=1 Tax=Armatimonas rosea TaxID=685828 RepID=A0A7W9SUT0_ARMRO|nr:FKBP-type peptidyl-prolyl cis-trans isomerase [Armatimonas rosea]MBB6052438.1 hypothetical protein [Armatimonas rosea]